MLGISLQCPSERYGSFMIRLILVAVFLILFLILSTPLMLVEWLLGKSNPDAKSRSSLAIVNWAFRCVRFLAGVKVDYIGEENIPTDTPVLYIGSSARTDAGTNGGTAILTG